MIQFFGVGEVEFPAKILKNIIVDVNDETIDVVITEENIHVEIECE